MSTPRRKRGSDFIQFAAALLTIVSAALGVATFFGFDALLKSLFSENGFMLKIIPYVLALSVTIVLFLLSRTNNLPQKILSFFLNLTVPAKLNYEMIQKKCIYTFESRTQMSFQKTYKPRVIRGSFTGLEDNFAWTGTRDLSMKPTCPIPGQVYRYIDQEFGPYHYEIRFKNNRSFHKGEDVPQMELVIDKIEDLNGSAFPHLSSGVTEKTDELVLEVRFKKDIEVCDIRKLTYLHYTDREHEISEVASLQQDGDYMVVTWPIRKPVYGGKYVIEWNFGE